MNIEMNVPGYDHLATVFQGAYNQAARTKGAERHANSLPFHKQPMQTIADKHGVGFLLGQVDKKITEAHGMLRRGEIDKALHELLGAINYTAGAIIHIEANAEITTRVVQKTEEMRQADQAFEKCKSDSASESTAQTGPAVKRVESKSPAFEAPYGDVAQQIADNDAPNSTMANAMREAVCQCPKCDFKRMVKEIAGDDIQVEFVGSGSLDELLSQLFGPRKA